MRGNGFGNGNRVKTPKTLQCRPGVFEQSLSAGRRLKVVEEIRVFQFRTVVIRRTGMLVRINKWDNILIINRVVLCPLLGRSSTPNARRRRCFLIFKDNDNDDGSEQ